MKIFNRQSKTRRQQLRSNVGEPERLLWQALRHNQLNAKFRRQHGIGDYIVDFYCPTQRLVIEIDGVTHEAVAAQQRDQRRDEFMKSLDIRVLRFSNAQVMQEKEAVLQSILIALQQD